MSFIGDVLGFEKFQLKDWFKKAKKNPEQLFLGAATPAGAKLWGGILGKDYEPFVDQMGGAYGGNVISGFGNADAGVYGRAKEAGVPTKAGGQMHDLAHVVAAIMATNGAAGGGLFGGGGGAGAGVGGFPGASGTGFGGSVGVEPAAAAGGINPLAGGGGAAGGSSGGFMGNLFGGQGSGGGSFNPQLLQQMMGQQGGETEKQRRIRESNELIAMILSKGQGRYG